MSGVSSSGSSVTGFASSKRRGVTGIGIALGIGAGRAPAIGRRIRTSLSLRNCGFSDSGMAPGMLSRGGVGPLCARMAVTHTARNRSWEMKEKK